MSSSTIELELTIPGQQEQQASRERFLETYGSSTSWPSPKGEKWYWEETQPPWLSFPIWKSVFLDPALIYLGICSPPRDPTFGRYTLPFSPQEQSIRQSKTYTCWDARIFLKPSQDGQLIEPAQSQTDQWIWYQVWFDEAAASRTGAKLDLLYCHGMGEYGGNFSKHAKKFLDAGYRVIVLDLPSHGRSTGFHTHLTNLDCLAHAVHVVLADVIKRDLASNRAQQDVVIAGQSMGGFTTVLYGLLYHSPTITNRPIIRGLPRPRLIGLIPLCPMLEISDDSRPAYMVEVFARMISRFAGRLPLADANKGKNTQDPWCEDQFRKDPQTYSGSLRVATGLAVLDAIEFTAERMSELDVPFQVMHGGSDRVTSPLGSLQLYKRAKAKQKTMKIYPFVEHVMLRAGRDEQDDLARVEILDEMISWIDQIRKPST